MNASMISMSCKTKKS